MHSNTVCRHVIVPFRVVSSSTLIYDTSLFFRCHFFVLVISRFVSVSLSWFVCTSTTFTTYVLCVHKPYTNVIHNKISAVGWEKERTRSGRMLPVLLSVVRLTRPRSLWSSNKINLLPQRHRSSLFRVDVVASDRLSLCQADSRTLLWIQRSWDWTLALMGKLSQIRHWRPFTFTFCCTP